MKKILEKIPKLPLSALIFYLSVVLLWKTGLITSPANILLFLETLYKSYGLAGLFVASFLEGIVYLGLYFPGSFIVALAVIVSDGNFKSFLYISMVVASALTLTSMINYVLGGKLSKKLNAGEVGGNKNIFSKGLLASFIHPNALAFYFFNSGIKKRNFLKISLVPLFMIPYGFILACVFYSIRKPLKRTLESPYLMVTFIFVWLLFAFLLGKNKSNC